MSIPLDRLYHYIESVANKLHGDITIYRFWPHGSKKIEHLDFLKPHSNWLQRRLNLEIFCYDQEPLNYLMYENNNIEQFHTDQITFAFNNKYPNQPKFNFRGTVKTIWDKAILLHSELRSSEVDLYADCNFVPVYYWCHALIARDWFRFAQHVVQKKQPQKLFLIYNRSWSGTREYRLKFLDLVIENDIVDCCKTSLSPVESELGIHYSQHTYKNNDWKPCSILENWFETNQASSCASADFELQDYESTHVEVVLETLFDDTRWHLTEKILRTIACGQPFILAASYQSLQYLRSYGFQTFDSVWDESYDQVEDPQRRLATIVDLMKQISAWDSDLLKIKMSRAQKIAEHNKKLFFSDDFFATVISELEQNLQTAFADIEQNNTAKYFLEKIELIKSNQEWYKIYKQEDITDMDVEYLIGQAMQYYKRWHP